VTIEFATVQVASSDRNEFERALRAAIVKVCAWWGRAFIGKFVVSIEDSRGPSMALVPAWRGEHGTMLFRAGPVRARVAAVEHEVTHVFAPNANRLLAEGLATYAHEHLKGGKAYPNNGVDLHQAATRFAEVDLEELERVATPERLQQPGLDEPSAYIVAGSFVRFIIERYGMDRFRHLYDSTPLAPGKREAGDPHRWQAVYGKELAALVGEWRASLAR
jgi:hypothetical protein